MKQREMKLADGGMDGVVGAVYWVAPKKRFDSVPTSPTPPQLIWDEEEIK